MFLNVQFFVLIFFLIEWITLNLVELLQVDVDFVEESMRMIGGLQSLART